MNYKTILLKEDSYNLLNKVRLERSLVDATNHSFDAIIVYLLSLAVTKEEND
jgi:hypothetical protein